MNPGNLIQILKLAKADGANPSCIILATDEGILCTATSPDESLITAVASTETFEVRNQLGIRDIDKLIKMLQLHGEDIDIKLHRNKLIIQDTGDKSKKAAKSEYAVADPNYINVRELGIEITYDGEIILDQETIQLFIKSMKVLSDSKTIGIVLSDDMSTVIVGEASDFSNKTSFNVPSKVYAASGIFEIFYLNLQFVKQILETNSTCTDCKLLISMQGIVQFIFRYENTSVNYHLIALEENG